MTLASRPRPRALLLGALASALAVPMLAVPTAAVAEDGPAAGDVVVGTLVQAWSEERHDHADGAPVPAEAEAQLLSWVEPARGEAVRVPTEDLPEIEGLAAGATVEVTIGDEVVDEPAADGLDEANEIVDVDLLEAAPEFAAASRGVVNEVTVVMVRPGGVPVPAEAETLSAVVAEVDGPVRTFWAEQTDDAVQLSVTGQHDWISTTATCANPQALFQEVDTLVNWPGGDNRHLLLYIPPGTPGCGDGLATVGNGLASGGYLYVTGELLTSIVAHEIGHNLGLGHASSLQCDGTVEGDNCGLFEYFDLYDVMGLSWDELGSLNTVHADRLGLLAPTSVSAVSILSGEYVQPLDPLADVGLNGIRLVDPVTGISDGVEYWLEYRYPRGRDAWLGDPSTNFFGLDSGVLLRMAADGDDTSLLLDGTPSPEAEWEDDLQAALPVGVRVPVAGGAFFVTVESADSAAARIRIEPQSPIRAVYERSGGATGPLGPGDGSILCSADGSFCNEAYANGRIYWSVTNSPQVLMYGPIYDKWELTGYELGSLGLPIAGQVCGLPAGGCFQRFEGGRIYWSPGTGARVVRDEIFGPWGQRSYERGFLGYPVADTVCGLRDGGCFQRFQGGTLYTSRVGTGAVKGHIYNRWAAGTWERGRLGYPRGDEVCSAGRCIQQFQGGRIAWTYPTGARAVVGAIGAHWGSGFSSPQGFPTADERCGLVRGGCFQSFQYGSVYWSSATGAHTVGLRSPQIRNSWAAQGWERGRLGYPAGPETKLTYGWSQRFQGGTLVWDSRTNRVTRR